MKDIIETNALKRHYLYCIIGFNIYFQSVHLPQSLRFNDSHVWLSEETSLYSRGLQLCGLAEGGEEMVLSKWWMSAPATHTNGASHASACCLCKWSCAHSHTRPLFVWYEPQPGGLGPLLCFIYINGY